MRNYRMLCLSASAIISKNSFEMSSNFIKEENSKMLFNIAY